MSCTFRCDSHSTWTQRSEAQADGFLRALRPFCLLRSLLAASLSGRCFALCSLLRSLMPASLSNECLLRALYLLRACFLNLLSVSRILFLLLARGVQQHHRHDDSRSSECKFEGPEGEGSVD